MTTKREFTQVTCPFLPGLRVTLSFEKPGSFKGGEPDSRDNWGLPLSSFRSLYEMEEPFSPELGKYHDHTSKP